MNEIFEANPRVARVDCLCGLHLGLVNLIVTCDAGVHRHLHVERHAPTIVCRFGQSLLPAATGEKPFTVMLSETSESFPSVLGRLRSPRIRLRDKVPDRLDILTASETIAKLDKFTRCCLS